MNPLLVRNDTIATGTTPKSEYWGDAASDLHGTLSAVDQSPSILGIDWDGLPDIIIVRDDTVYTPVSGVTYWPQALEKTSTGYTDRYTWYPPWATFFMVPVYFANGFIGWDMHHIPQGLTPSPPNGFVAIWRRAYNVNDTHGMSPLGRYTYIRCWDTISQSSASSAKEAAYLSGRTSLQVKGQPVPWPPEPTP